MITVSTTTHEISKDEIKKMLAKELELDLAKVDIYFHNRYEDNDGYSSPVLIK